MATGREYEREHIENTASGAFRASIFGVSDGLVSNLGLVMGVAGGGGDPSMILLAGVAGLLAGSLSMAAGEYVSMQTQREVLERELEIERQHIERHPAEEERHLAEMLEQNGLETGTARRFAAAVHESGPALDFHALFELGIAPGQLGSPVAAAVYSCFSFAAGAAVPLVPWIFSWRGSADALPASIAISAVGLLAVGGGVTYVTRQHPLLGAFRQLAIGALAAGATYAIGYWIAS